MTKYGCEKTENDEPSLTSKKGHVLDNASEPANRSRRSFLAKAGAAATVAVAARALNLESTANAQSPAVSGSSGEIGPLSDSARAQACFNLRQSVAQADFNQPLVSHPSNGDDSLYPDKCGSFSKALPHDIYGRVDLSAYQSLITALSTGSPSDFENITLGGTAKLTNPQAGLGFDLEGMDGHNLTVPAAPTLASPQMATEMVEMYWASLLRDVPFSQYSSNSMAQQAALELTNMPAYQGPRDSNGSVTPQLLFRGGLGSTFAGETVGPYTSQFALIPTALGVQPISQQWRVFHSGQDFVTSFSDWLTVQSGGSTGLNPQMDPQVRYPRNGRDWAAFTHIDVLSQAYFVALLVLANLNAPLNPGLPYHNSRTQGGFGTFGGGDFAGTLNEVATRALKAVWFQKWYVHRRLRPDATGGLVHLMNTGQGSQVSCRLNKTLLTSNAVQQSFRKNGSYLLSQAFSEGSPTHPSYPTGHGTVGGACITVLKFFFDGHFVIPNPVMPTDDGLSLQPYTGSSLTVNGELNKIGHNVSFGHGIHPGIHYRSDTDQSLLLGEAVALSVLRDRASCYNEKFSVNLTKFDGTTATISN
ncbi:MAG TPA: vanadium-dependent haloperoxidase [Candidatus Bathyarchaeia archaeon]|nr:vanadium-dependent haloperoxidase [Candidatus Bathyarchaeia archaeon]